jgi:lysophospholipase L1-like esterase
VARTKVGGVLLQTACRILVGVLALAVLARSSAAEAPALQTRIRVACIGASVTFGDGIDRREKNCYPAQLQTLLGAGYEVRNYGVNGCTMMKKGDLPFWNQKAWQETLAFNPDLVVIDLGGNDSKSQNWKFKDEFAPDARAMIAALRALPAKPRVLLCLPTPVFKVMWGINDDVITKELTPILRQVAAETGAELVDLRTPLLDKQAWFPDNVHPNAQGAALIAKTVGAVIAQKPSAAPAATPSAPAKPRDMKFDGKISREVLENYLSRSISMEGLLNGKGDFDDNLRMLKATGAKFIGRSLCLWAGEANLMSNLERARALVPKLHAADPEMILQGCIFEIVTTQVEKVPVPDWAFTALGLPVEQRNFRYADMLYPDGRFKGHWGGSGSVPDVSRPETKLWFYFLGASFIDAGLEAIHFGQTELMNKNDPKLDHYAQVLTLLRDYAAKHARRHMLLCDSHVPSGGLVRNGQLLMDFHSFPLRIMETPDKPQEAILKVGFSDGLYGRSKGGETPSGWKCEHLPYLVELDNFGASGKPGQAGAGTIWVWGYDEITWFAHQTREYRAGWLKYAWNWVRQTDPNGHLQMPGSRTMTSPLDRKKWYYANNPSPAVPEGLGDEEAIRSIWAEDGK